MKLLFAFCLVTVSLQVRAGSFDFEFVTDFLGSNDHIEAAVYFDSTKTSCLVDTGARFTMGRESLLRDKEKVGESNGGGVSGKINTSELVRSNVKTGEWHSSTNIVGRIADNRLPAECLLGNDFFLSRNFSIDFQKRKFAEEAEFSGEHFPLNRYLSDGGGHFGFKVAIEGEEIETLFDTGATKTVFDSDFVAAHPQNFEFLRKLDVTEGSNQSIQAGIYRAKSIRFGGMEDRDVEVYVLSLKHIQSKIPALKGIVGLNQMLSRKWYFNHRDSTWGALDN